MAASGKSGEVGVGDLPVPYDSCPSQGSERELIGPELMAMILSDCSQQVHGSLGFAVLANEQAHERALGIGQVA